MELEIITLSKISLLNKDRYHMLSFMCYLGGKRNDGEWRGSRDVLRDGVPVEEDIIYMNGSIIM
jgi:hypothetical protein